MKTIALILGMCAAMASGTFMSSTTPPPSVNPVVILQNSNKVIRRPIPVAVAVPGTPVVVPGPVVGVPAAPLVPVPVAPAVVVAPVPVKRSEPTGILASIGKIWDSITHKSEQKS